MDELKIPKFENEADEANWAFEHLEELATLSMNQFGKDREKRHPRIEAVLRHALQTKEMVIAPEELNGRSLVAVLREKIARLQSGREHHKR
jgi:dipeptidase